MKSWKFTLLSSMIFILSIFACVYAVETVDSLGMLGKIVYGIIEKSPLSSEGAIIICTLIGFLINRLGQILLKALPTNAKIGPTGKITVNLFWKLVSWLWGASVDKYNVQISNTSVLNPVDVKNLVSQEVKNHVAKHKGIFKYL